jgi:hypothetical protein
MLRNKICRHLDSKRVVGYAIANPPYPLKGEEFIVGWVRRQQSRH